MKKLIPLIDFLIVSFTVVISPTVAENPEYDALVALYNSTEGANWSIRWNIGYPDFCSWYGITCEAGYVTILELNYNNLSGAIPADLAMLGNLQVLDLGDNNLSGAIPADLAMLGNLQFLDLSDNNLSDPIPSDLGNLSNLEVLYLDGNQFTDSIPPELGNLSNLELLSLYDNYLSGPIPPELGNLSNLSVLGLSFNQLSGSIPPELGNLSNLELLSLYDNYLSGPIPPELGNLHKLEGIYLSDNSLSGCIPAKLSNLGNLQTLDFYDNYLMGWETPASLMWALNLFSYTGPNQTCDHVALMALYETTNVKSWNNNSGWGSQDPYCGWYGVDCDEESRVTGLDLSFNNLSGLVPAEVTNTNHLVMLHLNGNPELVCWQTVAALDWANNLPDYLGPDVVCPSVGLPIAIVSWY